MLEKMFFSWIFLGFAISSIKADCILPLPRFRFFNPLIFSSEGNLLKTDSFDEHDLSITVPVNKEVTLSCAPNYFKTPSLNDSKTLTATCKSGEIFEVDGVDKNWLLDLGCEVRPVEEVIKSIPGCPDEATSVEFGYENPIKSKTQLIGEACYSEKEGRTIFVHTKFIKNGNEKYAELDTENVNYLAQKHPESQYKINFLVASRMDALNERLERQLSTKKVPFLAPRHFIDLPIWQNGQLYSTLKLGWNYAISNGFDYLANYDLILKDIMGFSELKNFDLYMGTHSKLSLKTKEEDVVDIYVLPNEQKYPVPKYLWIVVTTESGKGAGFLISNNIDAKPDDVAATAPCESKCAQMTWMSNLLNGNAYKNPTNGYVYCCEINKLMRVVTEMPSLEGRYTLLAGRTTHRQFGDI
ncbi:uncharacterized protein LOC129565448 [Sitodiplosis mosellana]|uniref:uncharacterized protein LOC129565448 n=1 Tax=Sitodiplosis mosellana TaxID=263140 RepID=UPI002444B8DC|nr:uncharacterized protein LOC129565448 [Sitodiplosis mosellana]